MVMNLGFTSSRREIYGYFTWIISWLIAIETQKCMVNLPPYIGLMVTRNKRNTHFFRGSWIPMKSQWTLHRSNIILSAKFTLDCGCGCLAKRYPISHGINVSFDLRNLRENCNLGSRVFHSRWGSSYRVRMVSCLCYNYLYTLDVSSDYFT